MKIFVVAALVALGGSRGAAQTAAGEIERVKQQYLEALNEADAATLARMSTERAILLPPNAEMIEGREAIEQYWRTGFSGGLRNASAKTLRVDEYGGDTAREIGRIHLNAPAPEDVLDGKYVIVWRKSGENWLLKHVILNST